MRFSSFKSVPLWLAITACVAISATSFFIGKTQTLVQNVTTLQSSLNEAQRKENHALTGENSALRHEAAALKSNLKTLAAEKEAVAQALAAQQTSLQAGRSELHTLVQRKEALEQALQLRLHDADAAIAALQKQKATALAAKEASQPPLSQSLAIMTPERRQAAQNLVGILLVSVMMMGGCGAILYQYARPKKKPLVEAMRFDKAAFSQHTREQSESILQRSFAPRGNWTLSGPAGFKRPVPTKKMRERQTLSTRGYTPMPPTIDI